MEAETVGDTLSDAQTMVDTLAYSVAEVAKRSKGDTRRAAQALVDTLADTLAEVDSETQWAMGRDWSTS